MNITIDEKSWRFAFYKVLTLEVIGLIFKLNNELTKGKNHLLIDNLVELLFILDINSLLKYYRCITGLSYYFNSEGRLRSGELYKLLNDNSDKFTIYTNTYNRKIIRYNNSSYISDDYLCSATEEIIRDVFNNNLTELLFTKAQYNYLFNVDSNKDNLANDLKYITLDFLIDKLNMNKEAIIEHLSLHNARLKDV